EAVRAAMESERGYDDAVWKQIATELGWSALVVGEEYDGLGLGALELALVVEKMGEHLLCAPFFSTVCLVANALSETGDNAAREWCLPEVAGGEITASLPLPSRGDWADDELKANRDGETWRMNGVCRRVPNGASADWLFVFAHVEGDDTPGLFAL